GLPRDWELTREWGVGSGESDRIGFPTPDSPLPTPDLLIPSPHLFQRCANRIERTGNHDLLALGGVREGFLQGGRHSIAAFTHVTKVPQGGEQRGRYCGPGVVFEGRKVPMV